MLCFSTMPRPAAFAFPLEAVFRLYTFFLGTAFRLCVFFLEAVFRPKDAFIIILPIKAVIDPAAYQPILLKRIKAVQHDPL